MPIRLCEVIVVLILIYCVTDFMRSVDTYCRSQNCWLAAHLMTGLLLILTTSLSTTTEMSSYQVTRVKLGSHM